MCFNHNDISHLILNRNLKIFIRNLFYLPWRIFIWNDEKSESKGLRSLRVERFSAAWPFLNGRLLDVGAHDNSLVNNYKKINRSRSENQSLGVDIADYGGGTIILENPARLPFEDGSFDTVSMLASFNYIPKKAEALQEIYRVLRTDGTVIISQPQPRIAKLIFIIKRLLSKSPMAGEPKENGKLSVLTKKEIVAYCRQGGFNLDRAVRFNMCTNCIYIFRKNKFIESCKSISNQ